MQGMQGSLPTPVKTGRPLVDAFFASLDRRIYSPTSEHPPDSKARLLAAKPILMLTAIADPDKFERAIASAYQKLNL